MTEYLPDLKSCDPALTKAEFAPGSPWLNFSAVLVLRQLVCLLPVRIFNHAVAEGREMGN